jgi:tripartite-type tricarboxylate transporter receptor subunit TctC
MRRYLREFDQVFDAEDMQILAAAFDKAWEAVQASAVIYSKDKVELVRAILAKHIMAAAKDGERDHSRLRDGALRALAQSNLR